MHMKFILNICVMVSIIFCCDANAGAKKVMRILIGVVANL